MNITYQNYPEQKSNIDFSKLPAAVTNIVPNLAKLDNYYKLAPKNETIKKAFEKVLDEVNKTNFIKSHIIVAKPAATVSKPKEDAPVKITPENYEDLKHTIDFNKLPEGVKTLVPNIAKLDNYAKLAPKNETINKAFLKALDFINKDESEKVKVKSEKTEAPFKKGDRVESDRGAATVKRVFKPAKGSALENEDYLIDILWDNGKKAINMPISQFALLDKADTKSTDSLKIKLASAEVLGTAAFKNGVMRAFSNDSEAVKLLADNEVGDPENEAIMSSWYRGYDSAKTNKPSKQTTKTTKTTKPKKETKPKAVKPAKHGHALIPEEVKLLRRVRLLIDKTKTQRDFLVVLNAIERADVTRTVTKDSPFAAELNYSIEWLRKAINHFEKHPEPQSFSFADEAILKRIMEAASGHEVMEAVLILKQYIKIQGRRDSKVAAQKLLARIEKYEKGGESPGHYSQHLKDIKKALQNYLNSNSSTMSVSSYTLSGIAEQCGCTLHDLGYIDDSNPDFLVKPPPPPAPAPVVKSDGYGLGEIAITDQPSEIIYSPYAEESQKADPNHGGIPLDKVVATSNGFRLPGDLGKLIGPIALNKYAIVIKGDSGAGKSRFALQLANAMAPILNKEAYFSMEMSPNNPEIKANYFDKYIAPTNRSKILTFDEGSLSKVKELAKKGIRAIFVDSWQKLYERSSEFGLLRNQFPGTAFVIIFQETTSGKARGGSESIYDSDLVIHVHKSADGDYKKNYAQCEKNRFAGTDLRYNIFTGKLM